jgi:hypothetical protein
MWFIDRMQSHNFLAERMPGMPGTGDGGKTCDGG